MDSLIDMKPILGEPLITYEYIQYDNEDNIEFRTESTSINPEFISNFLLFMFLLIFLGNILLRTIFRKGRR